MSISLRIILFIAILSYFLFIVALLRKNTLSLRYSLFWIALGIFFTISWLFPQLIDMFSVVFEIDEPLNGFFAALFFLLIVMLILFTAIISSMNEKIKNLTQQMALLDEKLRRKDTQE